jgi:Ca2+/Na+ antiporter
MWQYLFMHTLFLLGVGLMFEWKLKKSRLVFFILCTLLFCVYVITVFLPQRRIAKAITEEPIYINDPNLLKQNLNKMVSVDFEFGFGAQYMRGYFFAPERSYGFLKIKDIPEFITCSSSKFIEITLSDSNFVTLDFSKAKPDGNIYTLTGYVDIIDEQDRNTLKSKILSLHNEKKMMNSIDNTNLKYVVEILDKDEELQRYKKRCIGLIVITLIMVAAMALLIKEVKRYKAEKKISL